MKFDDLRNSVYETLECVEEDVNYINNEINTELKSLGCTEQIKYKQPITGDISRAKEILSTLPIEDVVLLGRVFYHIQTSAELQTLDQIQLNQRIKDIAKTLNELPVVDIDTLLS